MEEINIFTSALNRGLQEIINEQNRQYIRTLRSEIIDLVESKQDEKIIIKKIIDLLDDNHNNTYFNPRGW